MDRVQEKEYANLTTMIEFRDYQTEIIGKGAEVIRTHRFLYLAMEVRTGKTLTRSMSWITD